MSNPLKIVLGAVVLVVLIALAGTAYIWFSGGSGEASVALSAPTLAPDTPQPESTAAAAATAEATSAEESANSADSGATLFEIVPEQSEVRFTIYEELRGQPTDVVAKTNQVAAQIRINFDQPAATELGTVRINARTLETDNEFRNRAIRSRILQSAEDQYEFIEFTPTAIEGLPETITIGEPVTFKITGDLKVRDISHPVTFDATVTPVSETQIEGSATSTVLRDDYNLTIPNVQQVANVGEEVGVAIDFVAQAVSTAR